MLWEWFWSCLGLGSEWFGLGFGRELGTRLGQAWSRAGGEWGADPSAGGCPVAHTGGETEEEQLRVDLLENQVMDFRLSLVLICYSPDFVSGPCWGAHSRVPTLGCPC